TLDGHVDRTRVVLVNLLLPPHGMRTGDLGDHSRPQCSQDGNHRKQFCQGEPGRLEASRVVQDLRPKGWQYTIASRRNLAWLNRPRRYRLAQLFHTGHATHRFGKPAQPAVHSVSLASGAPGAE